MENTRQVGRERRDQNANLLENGARAAVEASRARPLTEGEWERERARLLEFVTILRDWDRQRKISESRGDNVVTIREAVTALTQAATAAWHSR